MICHLSTAWKVDKTFPLRASEYIPDLRLPHFQIPSVVARDDGRLFVVSRGLLDTYSMANGAFQKQINPWMAGELVLVLAGAGVGSLWVLTTRDDLVELGPTGQILRRIPLPQDVLAQPSWRRLAVKATGEPVVMAGDPSQVLIYGKDGQVKQRAETMLYSAMTVLPDGTIALASGEYVTLLNQRLEKRSGPYSQKRGWGALDSLTHHGPVLIGGIPLGRIVGWNDPVRRWP